LVGVGHAWAVVSTIVDLISIVVMAQRRVERRRVVAVGHGVVIEVKSAGRIEGVVLIGGAPRLASRSTETHRQNCKWQ